MRRIVGVGERGGGKIYFCIIYEIKLKNYFLQ